MYRIYLYLIFDNRKVARVLVDEHMERIQFPELLGRPFTPSTKLELVTVAELD